MTTTTPRGIITPEAVVLEFETASVGSRTIAILLDLLAQMMALGLLFSTVGTGLTAAGETVAIIAVFVLSFLVIFGYPVAMETFWDGRTLGKAALGLRVVTREGGPIRFRHAAIRTIFGLVDFYLFLGAVAVLTVILTRRNQRLGDLVAGTIVLRERTAAGRTYSVAFPPPPGFEAYAASLDVSVITPEQYSVIRSFLLRVNELKGAARARIAVELANPIAEAMRHQPPPNLHPELFLACVASAYQRRHALLSGMPWQISATWQPAPSQAAAPVPSMPVATHLPPPPAGAFRP